MDENVSSAAKCVNCKTLRVVCKKAGNVKLTVDSVNDITNSTSLTVSASKGIYYDNKKYTCKAGETFETKITADGVDTIKSYGSSNTSIATVDDNTTSVLKCINCKLVRVVCKKTGNAELYAESGNGKTTKSKITVGNTSVTEDKGSIYYDKTSYTCAVGQTISATITAEGGPVDNPYKVSSFASANADAVKITKDSTIAPRCVNCTAVKIQCLKAGTTKLNAISTSGVSTSVNVTVSENKGTIYYKKTSYTCNVGETFETLITAEGGPNPTDIRVSSYSSSNTTIAKIDANVTAIPNCINCKAVRVTCVKAGTTKLNATSSGGSTTSVSITVTEDVGTISYKQSSYTCNVGETFETIITAEGSSNPTQIRVKSYSSSNTAIAKMDDNVTAIPNCINCKAVRVTCVKAGTTKLNATSSTGATTSVNITVNNNTSSPSNSISFSKTDYTCKAGESFETSIITQYDPSTGTIPTVKSYSSNNTNFVTVDNNVTIAPNCLNCIAIRVVCKKAGTTKINATASDGGAATATVTVSN